MATEANFERRTAPELDRVHENPNHDDERSFIRPHSIETGHVRGKLVINVAELFA